MAGAGWRQFNTGDVLTASQVQNYLQDQTVLVFDDSSDRSTTLGTNVSEGMISYLKDTNAVERYDGSTWGAIGAGDIEGVTAGAGLTGGGTSGTVTLTNDMATTITTKGDLVVGTGAGTYARLAAGTNNYTLVADSSTSTGLAWQAPAGGGAYTLLTSGSLTGASVTSASLSGSYTDLKIVVSQYQGVSDDTYLAIRFNSDTGTNYQFGNNNFNFNATPNQTHIRTNVGVTNNGTSVSLNDIYIPNYSNSAVWKYASCWNVVRNGSGGQVGYGLYLGAWASTSAITTVTFFANTGNLNDGDYYIYGVK